MNPLLTPVRRQVWAGVVLSAVSALLSFVPFIAVAEFGRELIGERRSDVVWAWAGVGVASVVLSSFFYIAAIGVCHQADARFRFLTRRDIARHLGTVPLGWFLTGGSARVKRSVSDDVANVHTLVAHVIPDLTMTLVAPIAGIAYLMFADWRMALGLIAYIVIAMAIAMPRMQAAFVKNNEEYERAQQEIGKSTLELVEGISVVKAFGLCDRVFGRFTTAVDDASRVTTAWMAAIGRPVNALSIALAPGTLMVVIVAVGAWLISLDTLTASDLLPFLVVGVGLPASYMHLAQLNYPIRDAQVSAANIVEVLQVPPLPEPSSPRIPDGTRVEFRDVHFAYNDDRSVIKGVDFVLKPGTVTALVGPSGSGKSTLARLIPRFFDVTAGELLVGGVDVRDVDPGLLLSRMSIVFQDVVLLRESIRDNIRLGRADASDDDVYEAARAAAIYDEIAALPAGFDTIVDGDALSGGQRQRITVARAILSDAPIVLLDEATAHADPESEALIQTALSRLLQGRTVLVVAHRLNTIAGADQILVVEDGTIRERGTHTELLTAGGRYTGMWNAQEARV